MNDLNIFSYLNAINYKKYIKYDKSIANSYMLCLWLSHDKTLLNLLNDINKYLFLLQDEIVYNYLYNSVPRGKRFLKWTKKDKTEEEEKFEEQFEGYNISKREMMLYKKFMK